MNDSGPMSANKRISYSSCVLYYSLNPGVLGDDHSRRWIHFSHTSLRRIMGLGLRVLTRNRVLRLNVQQA
jgi:hypothetical protein